MQRHEHLNEFQRTEFPKRIAAMDAEQPGFATAWYELQERLCELGGHVVVPQPETLGELKALLENGAVCARGQLELVQGRRNACHANAAATWFNTAGAAVMWSGYVLSPVGLWRQHSWNVLGDRIVESTEIRDVYFGVPLGLVASVVTTLHNCDLDELDRGADPGFTAVIDAVIAALFADYDG
jgi:hypothetical protein